MSARITQDIIKSERIIQYTKCFKFDNGKFACQVEGCTAHLSDKSAAIRHLKSLHQKIVTAIKTEKDAFLDENLIEIKFKVNITTVWNTILQMIVFSALPYVFVQSAGFRELIKPFVTAFKNAGINFSSMNRTYKQNSMRRQLKLEHELPVK